MLSISGQQISGIPRPHKQNALAPFRCISIKKGQLRTWSRQLFAGATVCTAGALAFTEPFLFGLHTLADWVWWLAVTAAYFTGAKLVRRESEPNNR
jgi:hypothetical protein